MIQVKNDWHFVNDGNLTEKKNALEKSEKESHIELRRTNPCSSWQNGKVERSHREDKKILYSKKSLQAKNKLIKQLENISQDNNTDKTTFDFKSTN